MVCVEFHCHTIASKDSLTLPDKLLAACCKKGIDRVVITDHNTIAGALQAKEIDPQRVIVGEEVMTTAGELLAVFVVEEIPKGLTPVQAVARLREQGAFISVSHPFDKMRSGSWILSDLFQIAPLVDALETFNARCMLPSFNQKAQDFARQHRMPGTVGSDAHAVCEVGQATLLLPEFHDAESLKAVIFQGQKLVRLSPPWVHFYSRWANYVKRKIV